MKTKFYSIRILFFTLLCFLAFAGTVHAQIHLEVMDFTRNSDGTTTTVGDVLEYTIKVTSDNNPLSGSVLAYIPAGTIYKSNSTVVDGIPRSDVNGTTLYVYGDLVMLPANSSSTIKYRVIVTANIGTIKNSALLVPANTNVNPIPSNTTETRIMTESSCDRIYSLTTETESGTKYVPIPRPPKTIILPYQYIRTVSIDPSTPVEDIYDGTTGPCMEAPINGSSATPLPAGSILTDGVAMAFFPHYYRLYFVNRSVGGVPGDLCYLEIIDPVTETAVAYRHTGFKLNTTSEINRMTFDSRGTGYAITEDGQEFIHFTIGINTTNAPTVIQRVTLTPDPGNGTHDFFSETGGDICSDGSGKLYFVSGLGNVYVIDPAINVVKYVGSITGLPAGETRAVALDGNGYFYISGFYDGLFKVALSTLTATQVTNIVAFASSDFASCTAPISLARIGTGTTGTIPAVPQVSAEAFAKVQPNPFHNELNLQVQLNTTEQVRVKLVDFFGRTVFTTSEKMTAGVNSLRLPVPVNLSAGVYVVELWTGGKRILQKKIVKQ